MRTCKFSSPVSVNVLRRTGGTWGVRSQRAHPYSIASRDNDRSEKPPLGKKTKQNICVSSGDTGLPIGTMRQETTTKKSLSHDRSGASHCHVTQQTREKRPGIDVTQPGAAPVPTSRDEAPPPQSHSIPPPTGGWA